MIPQETRELVSETIEVHELAHCVIYRVFDDLGGHGECTCFLKGQVLSTVETSEIAKKMRVRAPELSKMNYESNRSCFL